MHRPLRSLVPVLFLPACASAEPEVRSVAAGDRVVVEEIALPPAVGVYRLVDVEDFGHPDLGSMARYAPADSLTGRLPRIDVVVYPARHGVDAEAAFARRGLMEYDRRSPGISRTEFKDERRFALGNGDSAYAVTISMHVESRPSRSLLYLHRAGNRFLKVRTTFPLPVGVGPDEVIHATVSAIFDRAVPVPAALEPSRK